MTHAFAPSRGDNASSAAVSTASQIGMELRLLGRRGENLFVTVILPLVMLVFLSLVPALSPGGIAFVVPGILALAVISTSLVNLGISTAFERSYGVLKRLGGTPLPRTGLIVAKITTVLLVELGQTVLVCAVGTMAFDWRPGPGAGPVVFVAAFGLGTLAFAGLGLLMAGTLRAEATLALANGLFVGFLLLGGIILPVEQLPPLLADLAYVLPAAALSEAFRIAVGASGGDPMGPLALLAAWGIGTTALAARTFRWE